MNLAPDWVRVLSEAGHEVVHWSTIGSSNAPDIEILSWARVNEFVVFTHDLDFGTILAFSQERKPSVIQLRSQEVTPTLAGSIVTSALEEFTVALGDGALVTIDSERSRARILPL